MQGHGGMSRITITGWILGRSRAGDRVLGRPYLSPGFASELVGKTAFMGSSDSTVVITMTVKGKCCVTTYGR